MLSLEKFFPGVGQEYRRRAYEREGDWCSPERSLDIHETSCISKNDNSHDSGA
jgi:hypothetical protein